MEVLIDRLRKLARIEVQEKEALLQTVSALQEELGSVRREHELLKAKISSLAWRPELASNSIWVPDVVEKRMFTSVVEEIQKMLCVHASSK